MSELRFLDLFAGAGGLSEGFIQAGFKPVAHIESDKAACFYSANAYGLSLVKINR